MCNQIISSTTIIKHHTILSFIFQSSVYIFYINAVVLNSTLQVSLRKLSQFGKVMIIISYVSRVINGKGNLCFNQLFLHFFTTSYFQFNQSQTCNYRLYFLVFIFPPIESLFRKRFKNFVLVVNIFTTFAKLFSKSFAEGTMGIISCILNFKQQGSFMQALGLFF